jgi:UDP-glucose 4-epimerase
MHFAAYAYVGESTAEPAKYYDNKHRRLGKAAPGLRRLRLQTLRVL